MNQGTRITHINTPDILPEKANTHTQTRKTAHRCECATSVPPLAGAEDALTPQYDWKGISSALNPLVNDESTGGAWTLRPLPGKCSILLFSTFLAKRC